MDDNIKTEKWTLDDGRRAVKKVMETSVDGQGEKIIELHVEDERPLRLQQRVVEKSKPIVFERKVETIDAQGNVVESKTESIEPKVQMQLVEHISSVNDVTVSAQSIDDCDCHVTKEEMIDAIVTAIKATKEVAVQMDVKSEMKPVAARVFHANELQTLGLADEIKGRTGNNISIADIALLVGIVGMIGVIVYMLLV